MEEPGRKEAAAVVIVLVLMYFTMRLPTIPQQNGFYAAGFAVVLGWVYSHAWWQMAGSIVVGVAVALATPYVFDGSVSRDARVLAGAFVLGLAVVSIAVGWWTIKHRDTGSA